LPSPRSIWWSAATCWPTMWRTCWSTRWNIMTGLS